VPEFGLGVITEMDVSEAFRPLWRLRLVFGALILLLGGAGVAATVTLRRSEVASRRAAQAEQKLRELGQYTLERKLGEGGMGAVYLATHRVLRRRTAVKLIRGETSPDAIRRFEREAQITCHLTHPNTVALYDYGTAADGTLYFAMEYLRGRDMAHLVGEFGPLPPARVVHLLAQAAGSLAEAHAAKLIHRDIKPANLYVCERGGIHDFVKVLDFGIAKGIQPGAGETAPGTIIGTPLYLAPECVLGRSPADGRSDLYSLGCVAWYLLTGTNLFARETAVAVVMAQVNDPVPPLAPSVPGGLAPDLERVVLGLLAKSPDHRPATAAQLLRDLRACADWGRWTEDDARDWWEKHPLPEQPADSDDGPPSVPTIFTTHGPV
jgi:serine/threonine protein kinase